MKNTVPLIGYSKYKVDLEQGQVYRNDGRMIKIRQTLTGQSYQLTRNDGKRKNIGYHRTLYAAMIGISPDTIPSDVYVIKTDDGYKLVNHSDHCIHNHEIARTNRIKMWRNVMAQKMEETQMLIDYYDTGNASPIVKYVMEKHEKMADYINRKYYFGRQTSRDVASEVIEDVCQRAVEHNLYITDISSTLRGRIRGAVCKRKNTTQYRQQ